MQIISLLFPKCEREIFSLARKKWKKERHFVELIHQIGNSTKIRTRNFYLVEHLIFFPIEHWPCQCTIPLFKKKNNNNKKYHNRLIIKSNISKIIVIKYLFESAMRPFFTWWILKLFFFFLVHSLASCMW